MDQTAWPPLTVSNFCSKSLTVGSGVALGSTLETELTGVTGVALGEGFCADEYAPKSTPITAEAAMGRSLRFMISSNTRVRAHETIFKYELALEERQTHPRVAWLKINCPMGQVRGSASPASLALSTRGFAWPRPCRLFEADSEGEF